jgi:late competence protein required for DNA uptake (superfamily II DNA/RNA helicase)
MNNCKKCGTRLSKSIELNLNGIYMCPNCILLYVIWNEKELQDFNILRDSDYTYELSKDLLKRLIKRNLTKKQYKELKLKYPNSWYLHDDFYDEEGNRLQPH